MSLRKNSIAIHLTRETLLDFGMVQPTPAEAEQRRRTRESLEQRRSDAMPRIRAALAQLDAITDPTARAVLELHTRDRDSAHAHCDGCDYSGYEGDSPDWPCRTVDLIAQLNNIDLSDYWLYEPQEDPR